MEKNIYKFVETVWYRADEVLPQKSGDSFIVIDKVGSVLVTSYSHEHKAFNAWDDIPPVYKYTDIVYWTNAEQIKEELKTYGSSENNK